jgi:hypothetical protein
MKRWITPVSEISGWDLLLRLTLIDVLLRPIGPWGIRPFILVVPAHPVSEQMQIRKLYALESMHDLRLSPDEQKPCNVPRLIVRPDYPRSPEVDYFRRGPRANELFYVYTRDGAKEVIRSFLTAETPN